jgi:hypothetical protein
MVFLNCINSLWAFQTPDFPNKRELRELTDYSDLQFSSENVVLKQYEDDWDFPDVSVSSRERSFGENQKNYLHEEIDTFHMKSNSSSTVAKRPGVKEHSEATGIWNGKYEREIMKKIQDKPISIVGEPTMISNCPHDCNNQGLCQRIFVKVLDSEKVDTYSYEPKFSCACKENFKGEHCQECQKGFFGKH